MPDMIVPYNSLVTLMLIAFALGIGLGGLVVGIWHRVRFGRWIDSQKDFERGLRAKT